jgi:hypothetical protein
MMADPDDLPEEIGAAMTEAGFAPTLPNLKELIANARAHEHEAAERRQQWPLLALLPAHVNAEVCRRSADNGTLTAERLGGRWYCTISDMEIWLKRTGRWFRTEAEEQQWRKMLANRKVQ